MKDRRINIKLFLCLIKGQTMKTYGGREVQLHTLLISALGERERSPKPRPLFAT
jgi:hypothetical protein